MIIETQIPIYRAKKIDSDERVKGYYVYDHHLSKHFILTMKGNMYEYKIDPSTLAIHFPGMIDSEGNKIFASLSEDGKGGDKVFYEDGLETFIIEFDFVSGVSMYEYLYNDEDEFECKNFVQRFDRNTVFKNYKQIGIQE